MNKRGKKPKDKDMMPEGDHMMPDGSMMRGKVKGGVKGGVKPKGYKAGRKCK